MPVNDNLYSEDHMHPCLANISCLLLIFCSQQRMKTTDFKPGQGYPETKLLKPTGSTLFTYRLCQKFSSCV